MDGAYPLYGSPTLGTRTVGGKNERVIFGVTTGGGASNKGVVFAITQSAMGRRFEVLHSFSQRGGGAYPFGTLVNLKGRLFGTAGFRGNSCCGTVFELTQRKEVWSETVLYSFTGGGDGGYPYSGVVVDSSGNLYGAAYTGGSGGSGVVYEVKP